MITIRIRRAPGNEGWTAKVYRNKKYTGLWDWGKNYEAALAKITMLAAADDKLGLEIDLKIGGSQ